MVHSLGVMEGDCNGITGARAAMKVQGAADHLLNEKIEHTFYPFGADDFKRRGITQLTDEDMQNLRRHKAIYKGAIGDSTKLPASVLEKGIILKTRQDFDLYVSLRPIVLDEGVKSILVGKDHRHINFEVNRENTEGLYSRDPRNGVEHKGTDEEVGVNIMKCTYRGVSRLVDYAAERAVLKWEEKGKPDRKPRLVIAFKLNVLPESGAPWERKYEETKAKRKDIDVEYMHIDACAMKMLNDPEYFDVIATENMFGDIITDPGAAISGGIGNGICGNIDPQRRAPSIFETISGSAPDKWYRTEGGILVPDTYVPEKVQRIRPEAAIRAYAMMLDFIGEKKAATAMTEAAKANLRNPDYEKMTLDQLVDDACRFVEGWGR